MSLPLSPVLPLQVIPTRRQLVSRAENTSEAKGSGERFLTPIIAGSICGGVLFILWGIGFAVYFKKRYRRKQRNRLVAAGKAKPRPKDLEEPKEKIVIPPDPAVPLGQHQPGEILFPDRRHSKDAHNRHHPWSSRHGSYLKTHGESSTVLPRPSLPENVETPTVGPEDSVIEEMFVPSNERVG